VPRRKDPLSRTQHRKVGTHLFNHSWSILERTTRSEEEDEELLHAAHASYYHWAHGGASLRNLSIGEWHLSRVYSVLRQPQPALHHGRRSLDFALRGRLSPFYVAYAYEALARASALAGKRAARARYLREARKVGRRIRDRHESKMLLDDLATVL